MPRPPIRSDELARLARLSRIGLDERELQSLRADLAEILAFARSVTEARVDESSCRAITDACRRSACREDVIRTWTGRVLEDSRHLRGGHVMVARVI